MNEVFNLVDPNPISLKILVLNLGIGMLLALALRWHFNKFGSTLSNRDEFSLVFPFILLTTVLIITVVKSSLALSLGLVGALSIVRFRTPIKEPEELAYLFISIAMGLGLGANQTLPTVVSGVLIMAMIALFKWKQRARFNKNLFLSIEWQLGNSDDERDVLTRLNGVIEQHVSQNDLRRFDIRDNCLEATYIIDVDHHNHLNDLVAALRVGFANVGITFLDQNQLPKL